MLSLKYPDTRGRGCVTETDNESRDDETKSERRKGRIERQIREAKTVIPKDQGDVSGPVT